MRRVTLYQTVKKEVTAFNGNTIPIFTQEPMLRAFNDPEGTQFLKRDVKVDHIPIERFCWGDGTGRIREVYAAFDFELLDLIGCKQEQVAASIARVSRQHQANTDRAISRAEHAESVVKRYDTMTLWQRVKWVFKIP